MEANYFLCVRAAFVNVFGFGCKCVLSKNNLTRWESGNGKYYCSCKDL